MAVDLADYVPSLKREVQPPGGDLFPGTTSSQWVGYLVDAFWEARLDGFLEGYAADPDGQVTPTIEGASDIDRRDIALVILYAGIRVLRNRILNLSNFHAKAGPVEYEQQVSASMLTEMLKQLRATKDRILEEIENDETHVVVLDAYSTRVLSPASYFGSPELMG